MFYLIENDTIVGKTITPDSFPERQLVEGDDNDISLLYFDESQILLKPEPPSLNAFWDEEEKKWVEQALFTLPELPPQPDYLKFRLAMLQDPGYDRVTLASNVLRVTRMETAVSMNPPELPVVAAMWNTLISELTDKPLATEVKAWNAIATVANVPIKFGKDGKMSVV